MPEPPRAIPAGAVGVPPPTPELPKPDVPKPDVPSAPRRRRWNVEIDLASIAAVIVAIVALRLVLQVGDAARAALIRIGISAVLALALDPIVGLIQRRLAVRRLVAVLAIGAALAIVVTFVMTVLGPAAIGEAEQFSDQLPATVEQMYDFPFVGSRLEEADAATSARDWVADLPARVDDETIGNVTRSVLGGAMASFEVVIVTFALLVDGEAMVARLRRLFPPGRREPVDRVGRIFYKVFGRYFAGSLLVAIIAGLFVLTTGLALGVPLIPLAALWMVLVDLIPQVGGFLGGAVFVTLAVTKDLKTGVICLVLYVIYNTVENHVLQPAIVGQSVDLSPPTTMLAALIGGAAAGIPGALVATPIAGTVKALYLETRYGPQPQTQAHNPFTRWRTRRSRRADASHPA